jgi:hypothetical protein
LRLNLEEKDQLKVGSGVRAIPFNLGKNSNVETFEAGTLCGSVNGEGLNRFAISSFFSIIEGLAMFTIEAFTSSIVGLHINNHI